MREIKFRQLIENSDGEFTQWHYWGLIDGVFINPAGYGYSNKETISQSQQYTGLKGQMDGEEIYEGDIVLLKDEVARGDGQYDDEIGEAVWDESEACFMFKNSITTEYLGHAHPDEVIGNVHENPDLIEKPEQLKE